MHSRAAKSQPQKSEATVSFFRFDRAGLCVEWNGVIPARLPAPEGLSERAFLDEILSNALKLTAEETVCSARTAASLLLSGNASVTMELQGNQVVVVSSFECGNNRGYVLAPLGGREDAAARQVDTDTARDLLHSAIHPLRDGISLWDRDGCLIVCNPAFSSFVGLAERDAQPGIRFENFARAVAARGHFAPHSDSKDALIRLSEQTAAETRLDTRDGRPVTFSGRKSDAGELLLTLSDQSGRDQIEQAQREADLLVRTIVDASPTPFLVSRVDDGRILYCPPASRERFGQLDTTLGFFLNPEDRQAYLDALLPTGQLDNYPVRFFKQDGSVMQGLTSARVIDFKGENVIVSSTRDMTDYLQMQDELEKQREIAHQNEKLSALGSLLAGVAHELNNPLSIVVGYALMLQDKVDDPVLKRRVERIGQAAERCTRIVRAFLAMARQRPMEIVQCDVGTLVEAALEISGYGLKSSGADVRVELDPNAPCVDADPDQIVQVLTNLVVNAEHAVASLGEQGRVTLRSGTEPKSGHVFIEVDDNGHGIDPAIQSRIFEPFFTTKVAGEGTGVGLAFCHRIVTSHGGRLTVETAPGEGAKFRICLKPASPDQAAPNAEEAPTSNTSRLKVLSIDDEQDVTELISDILEDAGYEVTTCNDSRDALNLLERDEYDVILSDMTMPGLDGTELLKLIAQQKPECLNRFGFVTGNAMSRKTIEFLKSNNCRYMEKPIAPQDLLRLVDQIFSSHEAGGPRS
ncbi:ATP-binding protein [Ruegeria sp. HKCCA5491]|uniref:hybrid sensor histidine kinase/response regulator n=1 Tax=Ruegeria sp. HKCCA5491 TaxID=2682986 RepID=UPI0014899346|nr:ATP-binding protein [Ruegeria sp. HKCCA5491]